MSSESKTEKRTLDGTLGLKEVTVLVHPFLTKDESREMFPYRPLNKYAESRWGGNNLADDIALLINTNAERCAMC